MSPKKPNIYPDMKILIVDDVPNVLTKMRIILRNIGFRRIDEASNGEQAWTWIQTEFACDDPYQLVITDINMPKLNGVKLLDRIKSDPFLKKTPVLMVTTRDEMEIVLRAIQSGASNYLIKPFDEEKIKKKIMEIFYKDEED
jgi:two-component system, chemotaxis family, chemotaxis protein CheY